MNGKRRRSSSRKKSMVLPVILIVAAIIIITAGIFLFFRLRGTGEKPSDILKNYFSYITSQDYEKMYNLVDAGDVSKDDFISRNQNIYEGIGCSDVKVKIKSEETDSVSYSVTLTTLAGEISYDNTARFTDDSEKGTVLVWDDSVIFPELTSTDKVRIYTDEAARGQILDRNNVVLAGTGTAYSVGLVPGEMNEEHSADVETLAELLGMTSDDIESELSQGWVTDDSFVPLKTISASDAELRSKLLEVSGVMLSTVEVRNYPYGNATAHLIGYVSNVTAEDLEEHPDAGYSSDSVIGKSGLESLYEDELRGKNGYTIVIEDENGEQKSVLAYQDKTDGENIRLTIDITLQQALYEQFQEDEGCSVAMNPYTGEVLALVSTPSYDTNQFVLGLTTDQWNTLNNDESQPLYNRFRQTFAPGSTLKPFTAAIGLAEGTIDPNQDYGSNGTSWQKDSSWGSYYVTTLQDYSPGTLENALIYSDNIFFAKAALTLGADKFTAGLDKFGFNQVVPFEIKMSQSQYDNDGSITDEIQLADSGYGQGQVLANPLHLAVMYTAFSNNGSMIQPYLIYKDNPSATVWIENAISQENTSILTEDLKSVVNNPAGSGYAAYRNDMELAGKTGTAELKSEQGTTGQEIGWFSVFTTDQNTSKPVLLVSMVEHVEDKGGSTYVVEKDDAVLDEYLGS
nr:penicillin-binding transpeptidase domain-containing protein [uncultured Sellimonas sp.]